MTHSMTRRTVVVGFDGYQELHVWYPVLRLREEGDEVVLAGPDGVDAAFGALQYPLAPQRSVAELDPAAVDLLVVPGGPGATVAAADTSLVEFVGKAAGVGTTVVAVAEGVEILTAAGIDVPAASGAVTEGGGVVLARDADALPELFRLITA
jgi:protease I